MPVYAFKGCRLDTAGPLRDAHGREVLVDVSRGGQYTVQVVPTAGLITTGVLEVVKSNDPIAPRKSLATPVTITSTAAGQLTTVLTPEAAFVGVDVTTGEAGKMADVFIWHLPPADGNV